MNSRARWFAFIALLVVGVSCSDQGKENTQSEASATSQRATSGSAISPIESAPVKTEDLGAIVDLIVAGANELPRAEFDPAALAAASGGDPKRLFEWVRDRTWWAPYRGLLRGAQGVMLDRVGSSLDRAVLLGDLMRRSGHTVRLAHAQLSESQARELLGKLRPIPDQRRISAAPKPASIERERATESFLPGFKKAIEERTARSRRLSEEATALVRSQSQHLLAAVSDVAPKEAGDIRVAVAAIQDHWWVEWEQDGNWTAIDVLLPDAAIGNALVVASATSEWNAVATAPSIPDSDWHSVQIRIVVERYQDGVTTEATALETVLRPAEVFARPVMLSHLPKPWPEETPDSKTDRNARKNAALWVNRWVPILQVGDDYVVQSAFTDSGELTPSSSDSAAGLGAARGGGLDFSGTSLSGGEETESFATAEWLDYEIRVPGESSQRLRRPVFDLLGPSKRSKKEPGFAAHDDALKLERFEALSSRTDILLQPCDFTGSFVTHLRSRSVLENQAAIRELAKESDPTKARASATDILARIERWGPLPGLVLWRSSLGGQTADWFVDRPNVLNYHVSESVAITDRVATNELIDFASNAIGVRQGASRSSFEVRLRQGVTDTVAEMLAVGGNLRAAQNTASIFELAGDGPGRSVRILSRDAVAVTNLGWPDDVAARLVDNINSGYIAIALRQPVSVQERQHLGWWRIDPASGETIGVMDTGFHAALPDDVLGRAQSARYALLKEKLFMLENVGLDESLLTAAEVADIALIDKMVMALLLLTGL